MGEAVRSTYSESYNTYSGCDIICTFGGKVIGELQSISYSVTREKMPVYVMGDANPKSFSRGKRGIAGSLVFTVFDRDSLVSLKNDPNLMITKAAANLGSATPSNVAGSLEMSQWDEYQTDNNTYKEVSAVYADEIPPFDVTITMKNEYGHGAVMAIYGVEILNEGMGLSIDDLTTEKACTFVARGIEHLRAL